MLRRRAAPWLFAGVLFIGMVIHLLGILATFTATKFVFYVHSYVLAQIELRIRSCPRLLINRGFSFVRRRKTYTQLLFQLDVILAGDYFTCWQEIITS